MCETDEIGLIVIKLIIIVSMLIGCSSTSTSPVLGHWVDHYPSEYSVWQCVEPFSPYKNKEC